ASAPVTLRRPRFQSCSRFDDRSAQSTGTPLENRLRSLEVALRQLRWLDPGLDHDIDGSARHDQMLHAVAPDQQELAAPIYVRLIHHGQTLRRTWTEEVPGQGFLERVPRRSCGEIAAQQHPAQDQ